ncbi:MAG: gliding motility-associated C-terminal domain-containing protein [Bacteroidota bacterium]
MFFILRAKFFFCSIFTLFVSAVFSQSCDLSVVPPAIINGVDISAVSSGSVSTYASSFTSCTAFTPANSVYLGQMGAFSYTMNFSEPVNNIVVAITATGGTFNENFIFNTNTGVPTIGVLSSCFSVVSGNEVLSGENSGNMGGGGEFVITAAVEYTSLTITGSGGENGALLSICSNSIVPVICLAGESTPDLSVTSLLTGCFSTTTDLNTVTPVNMPAGTILTWHSDAVATAANRLQSTLVGPGTYYAAFYDGVNDCYGHHTSPITVSLPSGAISAGPDLKICLGESVILNGSAGSNFSWNNNVGNGISFLPAESAIYTLSGLNIHNCPDTDEVEIIVYTLPSVYAGPDLSICPGEEVTLSGTGALHYTWEKQIVNDAAFRPYTSGSYEVTGSDINGCRGTDEVFITVYPQPQAAFFIPGAEEITELNPLVSTINNSTGALTYSWDFQDLSGFSTETEPQHLYSEPGTYVITLIAANEFGCTDTTRQSVDVKNMALYYVPNAFTPNGDEHNNTFTPSFNENFTPGDYELLIYNRWGELLFESHDHFVGWDGTYQNRSAMAGIYTWVMGFRSPESDKYIRLDGSVNLIK